jgi:hypothetical protein
MQEPVTDDIAVCRFDRGEDDYEDFRTNVKRLSILESVEELGLGEPVGVVGFPFGTDLHVDKRKDAKKLVRMGPLLQHGFISGFQPWQKSIGIKEILLDVRAIGGMSGSPVFRQKTGQVIGVLWGGEPMGGVISRAVPIDWVRVSTWLTMLDSTPNDQGLVQGINRY